MINLAKNTGGIRGWHVLLGLVAFFGTVSAVDGVMIYKAVSTFGGDTRDAYRTGLAYNERIAEQIQQDQLGWTDASAFDGASSEFRFTLKDRDGHGVDGLRVTAVVGRPATDEYDREISLRPVGQGTYIADLAGLSEGTWFASVTASREAAAPGDITYRTKVRLWKRP
jgi:nitrogen fixation protein FixH